MIKKIEIEETSTFGNTTTIIDTNEKIIIKKDNKEIITEKRLKTDCNQIQNLIKDYTIFWRDTYQKTSTIDGKIIKIKIYSDSNFYTYTFNNDFPYNYNEFMAKLRELTNYDI